MEVSDFRHKTKKWNCFAATDTLGAFDFYTSIVSLDSLAPTDVAIAQQKILEITQKKDNGLDAKFDTDAYRQVTKVFPLAAHEYTHFIDTTSTLWGFRHLRMMKEAYEANDAIGGTEPDFCKAKKYYDHIRMLRLPKYYTLRDESSLNTTPWQYQLSAGLLFDSEGRSSDRAVVFTRFLNSTGNLLVRSPISNVSLLEMSAMAQEVLIDISLLANTDNNFMAIEGALYSERLIQYLYNPDITEYSVCVHLVANSLKLADPAIAFRICTALAGVTLNMPIASFSNIASSCPIGDILGLPSTHQGIEYFRNGLSSCDYGILFCLLCHALPKGDYASPQSIQSFVEVSIKKVGISIKDMRSNANLEVNELYQQLRNSVIPEIRMLAEAGYANFKIIGYDRERLPFQKLNLPPVLLADSTSSMIFSNSSNQLSTFNIDSAFTNLYEYGQAWVERFSEACV
jgi:hypothetical protein